MGEDYKKRVLITIFGTIAILLGILFLFGKTLPFYNRPLISRQKYIIIWYIGALCYILAGVGILSLKDWGRKLFLILSFLWLIKSILFFPLFAIFIINRKNIAYFIIAVIFYIVVYCVFPILTIYFFNRHPIKDLYIKRS